MSESTDSIVPMKSRFTGFLEDGYLVANPPELQKLCITAYQLLARGKPVSLAELAEATSYTKQRIEDLVALIPSSAYERQADGAFIGFIGLSINKTAHEFTVADRLLYTWCVFDALFLPAVLRTNALLSTICPATGREIKISIRPDGAAPITPPSPVMSIIAPDHEACCSDLRGAFCNHVNFFFDQSAYAQSNKGSNAGDAVSLGDAFALSMRRNDARFPDVKLSDLP